MKILKKLSLLGLTVTTLLGVVGCSSNNEVTDNNEQTSSETRIVQSVKGEVEIPTNPQRVVDISGSSEELILIGLTPEGTANVDSYETDKVTSYMSDTLGGSTIVGHSMLDTMDMEAILSLDPDLIIMAPRQEKIYDQLTEMAPTVMLEDQSNDWEQKMLDVATLFEEEDLINEWLTNYYESAEKVGNEIKEVNGEDKSYLTVLASQGQFMVFSEGGIGTVLKDDMNLPQPENMPAQDDITLPTVSVEGLAEIDADYLMVIATESDKADLENNSVFNEMRAVQEGNLIILDASPYFTQAYNPIGRQLLLEELKNTILK